LITDQPDLDNLADSCRETAAIEHVQPQHVEKDFNLTRLIWSMGEVAGRSLLLKGGTCLSKVDYGFHRMSEDADFVFPREEMPSGRDQAAKVIQPLTQKIKKAAEAAGMRLAERHQVLANIKLATDLTIHYDSRFEANDVGTILVQVEVRPVLCTPRQVRMHLLLTGELTAGYRDAYCWALHADEVRAEQVRAAFTREEIRDFYDLGLFINRKVDMDSESFRALVEAKLKEMDMPGLDRQHVNFGKSKQQIQELEATLGARLTVVRVNEDQFELEPVLSHFNKLWHLRS